MEQTAHRIAAGSVGARKTPPPGDGDEPINGNKPAASDSAIMKLDVAQGMVDLQLAKIGVQANTRVIAVEQELDRDTLDILA